MPFLVAKLLRLNGTELNVHGITILGFLVYAAISEMSVAAFLVAFIAREFRHR